MFGDGVVDGFESEALCGGLGVFFGDEDCDVVEFGVVWIGFSDEEGCILFGVESCGDSESVFVEGVFGE